MDDRDIVELYWQRAEEAIPATVAKYGAYCRTIAKNILANDDPPGWTGGNRYFTYDEAGNCRVHMGWQDYE